MSKSKNDKKKEANLPPINQKYVNENMIEDLSDQVKVENQEVDRLKGQLISLGLEHRVKGVEYIRETSAIEKALGDKTKQNINLTVELTQIQKDRADFEYSTKNHFEKKYEKLKEEQNKMAEKLANEMSQLRMESDERKMLIVDMQNQIDKLRAEVIKLNHDNLLTVEVYEKKIKESNLSYHFKLQTTIEIFETFLKNNPELITTDLFTVYHQLKSKYNTKITECLSYRETNEKLKGENRLFKLNLDNRESIINDCAIKQIKSKRKAKEYTEEINKQNKEIELMKGEYLRRYNEVNEKFNEFISSNDSEMQSLKKTIAIKNKEIEELKYCSEAILKQRSDIELFFIDALKETKREIVEKKKKDKEKKLGKYFSFLNRKSADDGLYLTSARAVEIRDLNPENKEKILRSMFNKLHESKMAKNFSNLRKLLN